MLLHDMCWLNIFGSERKQNKIIATWQRKPFNMKTDKNLFLYIYNCYTLAIVPLHTALSTIKALLLLNKDQHASSFNMLRMPADNFRMQINPDKSGYWLQFSTTLFTGI
jgi:hypothetical protein